MAKVSERVGEVNTRGAEPAGSAGVPRPEVYFLKYAFPCAFIGLQRGRFDKAIYRRLEKAAVGDGVLSFKEFAKYFPAAIRRISALKKRTGYKKWNAELIRDYFWNEHNKLIDAGEGDYKYAPESLRDLCKVIEGQVVSIKGEYAVV